MPASVVGGHSSRVVSAAQAASARQPATGKLGAVGAVSDSMSQTTNDEGRRTNEIRRPESEKRVGLNIFSAFMIRAFFGIRHSSFGIHSSFVIRHSSFRPGVYLRHSLSSRCSRRSILALPKP